MHYITSSFFRIFIIIILSISFTYSSAQVGKVKEKSKNDTRQNRSSETYSESRFFFDIINFFPFVVGLHRNMLDRKIDEPWLVSIDLRLNGGYYANESTSLILPSIRGNWGLLSTQVRWNRIQDLTGAYKTFDWQILQFNLVAIPQFNFRIGSGISYIKETSVTASEHFAGLEFHFNDRSINPLLEFRWVKNYETGSTPRFEMNIGSGFRVGTFGKFNVDIMGGFLYQRYYSEVDFYFIRTGINIHFY